MDPSLVFGVGNSRHFLENRIWRWCDILVFAQDLKGGDSTGIRTTSQRHVTVIAVKMIIVGVDPIPYALV